MNWDQLSFAEAAFVIIAVPCIVKCIVDVLSSTPRYRRATDEPDRSAVRGSQCLDANGHWLRRDCK